MANTRKSLIFSALSLLLCCALLVGTTFAWFTDSVTNTGNIITAGNLAINAYAYDIGEGGESFTVAGVNNGEEFTFEAEPQDLKEENCPPIISDDLWEPGKSNAKLLKVENAGTLAVKIKLDFETAGDLTDALWFDFIQVKSGEVTGSFTKRPMNTLSTFAKDLELPIIAKGDKLEFILVYGMYEEAGNEYKETKFTANVSILASQYTYEKDGFDNTDYDKDAEYSLAYVSDEAEFMAAAEEGKDIRLNNSINLSESVTFNKSAKIFMGDYDITIDASISNGQIATADTLVIEGNGTITGALVVKTGGTLIINGGRDFKVESSFITGAAISANLNTTLEINGGTYTSYEKGAGVINSNGSYVTIRNAVVNVGVDSMSQSAGIVAANAKETLLENVTVNAEYGTAVKLNTAMSGNATIIGGTFTTSKVASGWKPNDTIRYGGTLNISGATINRVGTGILYYKSYPLPTEVTGLTYSEVTFNNAGDSASDYKDINYYRY